MCFTVPFFYLRNKTLFLYISWSWFPNIDILGTPKIIIMNICDVNSFQKMLHFTWSQKWMVETWFFGDIERASGCTRNIQKFAYTYRYTGLRIFLIHFRYYLYFLKIMIFETDKFYTIKIKNNINFKLPEIFLVHYK